MKFEVNDVSIGGSFGFSFFLAALGYFVYGGLDGAVAIFLLSLAIGFLSLLGFIPVLGVGVFYWIATGWAFPNIMAFTHLAGYSWLTAAILYLYLFLSIIFTIISTFVILATLVGRKW
jgi:hypothetical protein